MRSGMSRRASRRACSPRAACASRRGHRSPTSPAPPGAFSAPDATLTRMFSFVQLLRTKAPMIDIVDVGAMWLGEEVLAYRALVQANAARVVGFEPIQAECDKLNAMNRPNHRFLPYFIGDGKEATFR